MVLPASLSPLAVTTGLGICVRTPGAGEPASTSALLWVLAHGMRSGGRLQTRLVSWPQAAPFGRLAARDGVYPGSIAASAPINKTQKCFQKVFVGAEE